MTGMSENKPKVLQPLPAESRIYRAYNNRIK